MMLQKALKIINDNKISALDLSKSNIDDDQISQLTKALKNNNALTELNLSFNQVSDVGAQVLAKVLKVNDSLVTFDISWNKLGDTGVQVFAKAIEVNKSLTTLFLRGHQVSDDGAQALAKALEVNHSLTILNLGSNQLGNVGAQALAKILKANGSLVTLDLSSNQVSNRGAKALSKSFETNKSITNLSLRENEVGDAGAKAFAKALETNNCLTTLFLGENQVGDVGAEALAKALETNDSLTILDLGFNQIGALGTQVLTKLLETNHSLTTLDLFSNQIREVGYFSFYQVWESRNIRYSLVQKEAEAGDEEELTAYLNQYQVFPPPVLSLLIRHHHEALVMRWEIYWSTAALNYSDEEGNTPLHHAIQLHNENLVVWLLAKSVFLTRRNKKDQLPLTLLESANLLSSRVSYQLATRYLSGQEVKADKIKAFYYYEKASKAGYAPATWLLNLLHILEESVYLESVAVDKIIIAIELLPKLTLAEIETLILSLATSKGKLLPIFTQQDYSLYHLAAYLGFPEWVNVLKTLSSSFTNHLSLHLILMKNRQGLRPSALARQQAKFIADHKIVKLNSAEAAQDEVLMRYQACEVALRQTEEKVQLDLILLAQRNQQQIRLDYEGRAQALKDNIDLLRWRPKNVNQSLITSYAKVLQQVWGAKQTCIALGNQLKGQLKWPKGFDPFALNSPSQTLNYLVENSPSSRLTFQYKVQGFIIYAYYQYESAIKWLKLYEANTDAAFNTQETYAEVQIAFNQLINAYQNYKNLWKKAISNDDKEWLRSTPVILLQAGKAPTFVTPLTGKGENLSPAAKLSYFLNKGERIEGMAGAGTSPVFPIHGVHYKRNPHAPGVEFMVSSLGKVLAGEGATPTELMKVIGPDGIPYAYQASHTVQGKDLQSILQHHPECINKIRADNFAAVVILGMLTDPQDGKPDNYMVEFSQDEEGNITQVDILGIDNDIAFSDVVISQHKEGEKAGQYMMNIKNALYFFPQMMQPIEAGFRDKLLEKQPEFILLEWLRLLLAKNKEYEALLTEGVFALAEYAGDGRTSKRGLQLPIKVVAGTMARIYRKLKQLNEVLNKQPNITLWDLLMAIEPEVATHYVNVKQQYPHDFFGCDVMKCITALYEENVANGKELMWFRAQLDAGYTHTMTSLVLKTAEEFGFEDNRTTTLKDSVINVLKCLAYEDFKGILAPVLYQALETLAKEADLKDLLTTVLAHNCGACVYWLWQESVIERNEIQHQSENLKKYSLLHFFAQNKHLEGVKMLITQSIYPINICNSQGYTPLHMAASVGDGAIVKHLVENKAYVNAKTTLGKTALMMAESRRKQMNEQIPQKGDKKYADVIAYLTFSSPQPVKQENNRQSFASMSSEPSMTLKK